MSPPVPIRGPVRAAMIVPLLAGAFAVMAPTASSLAAEPPTNASVAASAVPSPSSLPALPKATPEELATVQDETCKAGDITHPFRVRANWAGVHTYGDLNSDGTANPKYQRSALPAHQCLNRRVSPQGGFVDRGGYTTVLAPDGWGWIMIDAIYGVG